MTQGEYEIVFTPGIVLPDIVPGMSRERYYLAGPMRGKKDHNLPEFDRVAAILRTKHKLTLISPAELTRKLPGIPGSLPYETYIRNDLRHLLECNAIILMQDWEYSTGAQCELTVAKTTNLRVFMLGPDDELTFTSMGNPSPFGL